MSVPLVTIYLRIAVDDASGTREWALPPTVMGLGVGSYEVVQDVTIAGNTFAALSVPVGAKAMLIRTTSPTLVLKGITGDTGFPITPASNVVGCDLFFTLGAAPAVGLLNNAATAAVATVVYF